MKANELFIGAFARVNRDGLCIKKGTIVEVRAVDADDKLKEKGLIGSAHCRPLNDDDQFEGGIWCEYLDPLLLTPEILEKNGFRRINEGEQHCERCVFVTNTEQAPQTVVDFSFYDDCIPADTLCKIWTKPSDCYGQNDVHICNLRYVRELQHALHLCGIEKEIVL